MQIDWLVTQLANVEGLFPELQYILELSGRQSNFVTRASEVVECSAVLVVCYLMTHLPSQLT